MGLFSFVFIGLFLLYWVLGGLLVDADVAAGGSSDGDVTIAENNQDGIPGSGRAVISHIHIECDSACVLHKTRAELCGVAYYRKASQWF